MARSIEIHIIIGGTAIFVMLIVPFIYVFRTGKFKRGVFLTWGLMVLTFFVLSIPLFDLVCHFYGVEVAAEFLPEGNSIVASICMGWLWGLVISSIKPAMAC